MSTGQWGDNWQSDRAAAEAQIDDALGEFSDVPMPDEHPINQALREAFMAVIDGDFRQCPHVALSEHAMPVVVDIGLNAVTCGNCLFSDQAEAEQHFCDVCKADLPTTADVRNHMLRKGFILIPVILCVNCSDELQRHERAATT